MNGGWSPRLDCPTVEREVSVTSDFPKWHAGCISKRQSRFKKSDRGSGREVIMSAQVIVLRQPFDPAKPEAERLYDNIVAQINRVSAERERSRRICSELKRQFIEDDLRVASGPREGEPLKTRGRRERLNRLIEATELKREQDGEYERLCTRLEEMNQDLDEWARQYWNSQAD